ncbi:hypothetical protein N7468_003422 [Penicillium chermesinum]|uniref:DUF7907 domain-containing protein n=1 Tax=Penicillium chermesinum TaxID=63820 RepID=A0A9W9P6F5_9EURO|nr:uncharacterized protein N7468_003422 [Penicillium chermesinum]KAJ5238803.1 hypothetical protein N7468_003422 [Penicillium chermesinum]KAJ6164442.1 hypothetical protein N7470_003114 [Penicillium chermesinum]
MKFIASVALLAGTAMASQKEFKLKSTGATLSQHDNLYLTAYHTGAGTNDAVFQSNATVASNFFLNGTNAFADLKTQYPWGIEIQSDTNYAAWDSVTINAGTGSDGFSVKGGELVWSEADGFGGWLICDWNHGVPQLFYLDRYYDDKIPSSCSKASLAVSQ